MPVWSDIDFLNSVRTVHSLGRASLGSIAIAQAMGSANWPAANRAIYIPFRLVAPFTCAQLWWYNGTIAGPPNVDAGVYTFDGRRLLSTGSTVQSGDSTIQAVDVTDTTFAPGLYYLALVVSVNSSGMFRINPAVAALRASGLAQQATALPLPTTATFAANSGGYVPIVGMTASAMI